MFQDTIYTLWGGGFSFSFADWISDMFPLLERMGTRLLFLAQLFPLPPRM
jgi:hypothetical protein